MRASTLLLALAVSSSQAAATDITWFCSAVLTGDKKPSAFKFKSQGADLIAFNTWEAAAFGKWEGNEKPVPQIFRIIENDEKMVVAVRSSGFDKVNGAAAELILIDRVANEFKQTSVSSKGGGLEFGGTCQEQ
jgi:hypothetical protein